ncbi:MAG: lysylphosphatidylglycerol synthase transmembrane domain-containing protein [Kofleriaceae bacterium]
MKLVASVLITAGVLYTIHAGGLKMVPNKGDFGSVRWGALALYAPLVLTMTWFRSVRWRFLLRQIIEVPKMRLFAVSCVGFMAILLLPFRLGELARPYMLRTRPEDVKPGKPVLTMTAATSSIVAERVLDGLFLSIILAIALVAIPTVHPLPEKVADLNITVAHVRLMGFAMLGLFTVAFITIAVFYFFRSFAVRATEIVFGIFSKKLAAKLASMASHLADGLHVFRRGKDFLGFMIETAIYWGCNALGMWILAIGCGIVHADGSNITFGETCCLMGMLGCTILIPGPPGLLGVFQAGLYAGMTFYFPANIVIGPGAAYVFLLYITQVVLQVGTGAWGLWHEGGTRRLQGALEATEAA